MDLMHAIGYARAEEWEQMTAHQPPAWRLGVHTDGRVYEMLCIDNQAKHHSPSAIDKRSRIFHLWYQSQMTHDE